MALAQIAELRARKLVAQSAKLGKVLLAILEDVEPSSQARGAGLMTGLDFSAHGKAAGSIVIRVVQEMLRHGVLITGSHNICYAHDDENIDTTLRAYDAALEVISEGLSTGSLEKRLSGPAIEPIFKVR